MELEASDARRDRLALPGRRDSARWGEPDRDAAGGGRTRGCSPRKMARLAWPSSSTDSPSRTASAPMMSAGSAWTQGMWDAEGTACALEPQFLQLGAGPGPARDDRRAARIRAGAGEHPGQRDGGGEQDQQDQEQQRDATGAPALDGDRAGRGGQQAHELGGQVAALGAHHLAELGGQRQPAGGGERLGDLADRELLEARW